MYALLALLFRAWTVWVAPGAEPVYVAWCRELPSGCEAYGEQLAGLSKWAGEGYGVPPALVVAVALRESGGNPEATGELGEFGPWQLNPRTRHGKAVLALCELDPGHCLEYQARAAAWLLAETRERCGDWRGALGAYNSGRCELSRGYARRVLMAWR